jgi:hypothetical protein
MLGWTSYAEGGTHLAKLNDPRKEQHAIRPLVWVWRCIFAPGASHRLASGRHGGGPMLKLTHSRRDTLHTKTAVVFIDVNERTLRNRLENARMLRILHSPRGTCTPLAAEHRP